MSDEKLLQLFNENNIEIPEWLLRFYDSGKILSYFYFLIENNEKGGFFSKSDYEKIFTRHLFESLVFCYYVSRHLSVSRETEIADAGTGPGLPGYLFSTMKNTPVLTLIDSSRRRLSLLEVFHVKQIGHNPITFTYGRLEEMKNLFDIITARALIPFPFVLELLCGNVKKNGYVVLYSADENSLHPQELDYVRRLGYAAREILVPEEVNIDSKRTIKFFQKIYDTAPGYPREWKKIKEELSQWQK